AARRRRARRGACRQAGRCRRLTPRPRITVPVNEGEPTTMATMTADQLLEAFEKMTVLELSEFKKKVEDKFGVTAAAPVAVAAAPAAGAPSPRSWSRPAGPLLAQREAAGGQPPRPRSRPSSLPP